MPIQQRSKNCNVYYDTNRYMYKGVSVYVLRETANMDSHLNDPTLEEVDMINYRLTKGFINMIKYKGGQDILRDNEVSEL